MKCAYCPTEVKPGEYVCKDCMADVSARAAEVETKARTVFCTSCHAAIGEACLTGSGLVRGIAHAVRAKFAQRAA